MNPCRLVLSSRPCLRTRALSTTLAQPKLVGVGDIQRVVQRGNDPTRIPVGYLQNVVPQETLQHLRWMLQKDSLQQDMFLIGPPSPQRRWLAMQFCELTEQEIEFVQLTRDTTESDLKQRREITGGDVLFVDQAPVRAAKEGRCLILDGVEKIERNVLPTINNLLENREMHLDDGQFMLSHDRFDELVKNGANVSNLVRVHPNFRVVALGLPVPPFPGSTLDPPLRSRFQARTILPPSPGTQLEDLLTYVPDCPLPLAKKLVTFVEGIRLVSEGNGGGNTSGRGSVPPFPTHALRTVASILTTCDQETDIVRALSRSYPLIHPSMPNEAVEESVRSMLNSAIKTYAMGSSSYDNNSSKNLIPKKKRPYAIPDTTEAAEKIQCEVAEDGLGTTLTMNIGNNVILSSRGGKMTKNTNNTNKHVVTLSSHADILLDMYQDHSIGCSDILLIGPKGSGKSVMARKFSEIIGHSSPILFSLYKDMTARDLLQRRTTDQQGNTIWEPSPVVEAAINGDLVVLDGLDRLSPDTLSALQRLIVDREVELFDGTRLARHNENENIHSKERVFKEEPSSSSMPTVPTMPTMPTMPTFKVHPSFRIVAVACPPTSSNNWMTDEITSWFRTSVLRPPTRQDVLDMISELHPNVPMNVFKKVLAFNKTLETITKHGHAKEVKRATGMSCLSLRQMLRLARHADAFPHAAESTLSKRIDDMLMVPYLPTGKKDVVREIMTSVGIEEGSTIDASLSSSPSSLTIDRSIDGELTIGDVTVHVNTTPSRPEMVPNPIFYEIPSHTAALHDMLRDLKAGEKHLLLLGPQGCGKNKLADYLLHLLGREREYVQLHRDSTVGTLTMSPSLQDGKLIWEDSPLVRAVENGYVLMVDEADKAPVEVTSVLKCLVEDEEMLLADGRRIVSRHHAMAGTKGTITIHPDFRMLVLANRPGFPFLGNNFFRDVGDLFPTHTIENPDEESERILLSSYGPTVKPGVVKALAAAFADLRREVTEGRMQYPYSTREAVAVIRHLEKYGEDGVSTSLEDVLSFDAFDGVARSQLAAIFKRHGIPVKKNPLEREENDVQTLTINLAQKKEIDGAKKMGTWMVKGQ
jgi:von Willebrand factor A domain-containing protein 8